jgi:hypothetical protein
MSEVATAPKVNSPISLSERAAQEIRKIMSTKEIPEG